MHKHKSKTTPIESVNGYDPVVAALADMIEDWAIEGARKAMADRKAISGEPNADPTRADADGEDRT